MSGHAVTIEVTLPDTNGTIYVNQETRVRNLIRIPDYLEDLVITLQPSISMPDVVITNIPEVTLQNNLCIAGEVKGPVLDYDIPWMQVSIQVLKKSIFVLQYFFEKKI